MCAHGMLLPICTVRLGVMGGIQHGQVPRLEYEDKGVHRPARRDAIRSSFHGSEINTVRAHGKMGKKRELFTV